MSTTTITLHNPLYCLRFSQNFASTFVTIYQLGDEKHYEEREGGGGGGGGGGGLRIFGNALSGFADFNNATERGLAENFGSDSGLFMSGSSERWILKEGLRRYVGGIVAKTRNETKLVKKKLA